jgi:tetratricopeptide (TPR) repeat protein
VRHADWPVDGLSSDELTAWYAEIVELVKAGKVESALENARRTLHRNPESSPVVRTFVKLAERSGGLEGRIRALRECARLDATREKAALQLTETLAAAGRHDEALDVLASMDDRIQVGPLGVERALLHRAAGRPDSAVEVLSTTLESNPFYQPAWDELLDLLETLGRSDEARAARGRRNVVPHLYSATEVVETIRAAFPDEAGTYVVNLGCGDGLKKDPCYDLYHQGYPGLAIDAIDTPKLRAKLQANLPGPEVKKVLGTRLTPMNVVEVLRREGCPERPVLVKIDIDSFDGPLLQAVLADFEPDVVYIETNPDFPPPLKFAVQYDPRYEPSVAAGFYGCSVSYSAAVGRAAGYELLEVDISNPTLRQDVTLVKNQYLTAFGVEASQDERELFLRNPFRVKFGLAQIGIDTRPWRTRTDFDVLLGEAWDACVAASLSRSGEVLPFVLTL